jgi:hypothetical protein
MVFSETSTGPGMKSLLCGCIEANVERPTPNVQYRIQKVGIRLIASMSILFFFLDERDVAAALDVLTRDVDPFGCAQGKTWVICFDDCELRSDTARSLRCLR